MFGQQLLGLTLRVLYMYTLDMCSILCCTNMAV